MFNFREELDLLTHRIITHQENIRQFDIDLANHIKEVTDLSEEVQELFNESEVVEYW